MIAWYYLVFIASVFYSFATLIEKGTLSAEHASAYSASFCLVAALFSLLLLPFANFNISMYSIGLILVIATITAVIYVLIARVYKHSNITVSSPVLSTLPQLFVVVLALVFLGEQLSPIKYASIAVMLVAIYFLMFKTGTKRRRPFEKEVYVYFLLGGTVLTAVSGILLKYVLHSVSPITFLILLQCFMAIEMMAYMQMRYGGVREIARNTRRFIVPIIAAAVFTTAYRLFYYVAVSSTFIALASPLLSAFTAITVVLIGVVAFREGNMKRKILLSVVMIAAVYVLVFV